MRYLEKSSRKSSRESKSKVDSQSEVKIKNSRLITTPNVVVLSFVDGVHVRYKYVWSF
jgi:hypothetical protein